MKSFREHVLYVVSKIPKGKVLSYGQVAEYAGSKNASRAVGSIMSHNKDKNVPCHRVVRSDGSIGQYNSLQGKDKGALLRSEGVKFTNTGKVLLDIAV